MRDILPACALLCCLSGVAAQFQRNQRNQRNHPLGRTHPIQQQQYNNQNFWAAAALFGGGLENMSDLFLLQSLNQGPGGLGSFDPFRNPPTARQIQALSLLGILDGPDRADAPAARGRGRGLRRGGRRRKAKPAPAGEAAEGAAPKPKPAAKKPRRPPPKRRQ